MMVAHQVINQILSTASGAVTIAAQIFSSANAERRGILFCNCGAETLYIGHTSDVSASKHAYKLVPGRTLLVFMAPGVSVYLFATSSTNYLAHEFTVWE